MLPKQPSPIPPAKIYQGSNAKTFFESSCPIFAGMAFLRANGFKTFIASGGGIEFMRVWAEKAYGIPPQFDHRLIDELVIQPVEARKFCGRDPASPMVKPTSRDVAIEVHQRAPV